MIFTPQQIMLSSWDMTAGVTTRLWAGWHGCSVPGRGSRFFLSLSLSLTYTHTKKDVYLTGSGATQPPIHGYCGSSWGKSDWSVMLTATST